MFRIKIYEKNRSRHSAIVSRSTSIFRVRYIIGSLPSDHVQLTGGGVDEKITLRITAGDGKGELLGRDVAIERPDL